MCELEEQELSSRQTTVTAEKCCAGQKRTRMLCKTEKQELSGRQAAVRYKCAQQDVAGKGTR